MGIYDVCVRIEGAHGVYRVRAKDFEDALRAVRETIDHGRLPAALHDLRCQPVHVHRGGILIGRVREAREA
jgi:hypothetical protein